MKRRLIENGAGRNLDRLAAAHGFRRPDRPGARFRVRLVRSPVEG